MAYIKYKEITKYFYFYKSLDIKTLPKYVLDYVDEDEKILAAYATYRDHGVFTDQKVILFDVMGVGLTAKQIHEIPYHSISSLSVLYNGTKASLIFYLDSGYPAILKFKGLTAEGKTSLRLLYSQIANKVRKGK